MTGAVVAISADAVETPRLLLASDIGTSDGMSNGNDSLGRHPLDHRFVTMLAMTNDAVTDFARPGHSVATLDHGKGESIPWGGRVIVDLMRSGRPHAFGVFGIAGMLRVGAPWLEAAGAHDIRRPA